MTPRALKQKLIALLAVPSDNALRINGQVWARYVPTWADERWMVSHEAKGAIWCQSPASAAEVLLKICPLGDLQEAVARVSSKDAKRVARRAFRNGWRLNGGTSIYFNGGPKWWIATVESCAIGDHATGHGRTKIHAATDAILGGMRRGYRYM